MARKDSMWFATEEHGLWLKCPDAALPITNVGWTTETLFLNGGYHRRRSANHAAGYSLSWSSVNREQVDALKGFYDGAYGQRPYYFVLPGTHDNILPVSWSTPRLQALDAPPLMRDLRPRTMVAAPSTWGYPTGSAHYVMNPELPVRSITVPVPKGFDLHLGVHGAYSGGSAMAYQVVGTTGWTTITPLTRTEGATNTVIPMADRPNGGLVTLSPLTGTSGTLTLNAMIAALRRPGESGPANGFVSGRGHSGAEFVTFEHAVNSVPADLYTMAAEFGEVEQWR